MPLSEMIYMFIQSPGITRPSGPQQKMMEVNFLGSVYPTRAVITTMKERRMGRIMFVSSQAGQIGLFGYTAYSPSKFALRGLAESLQMEVGSGTAVPCDNMSTNAVINFHGKPQEVIRGIDHMYYDLAQEWWG